MLTPLCSTRRVRALDHDGEAAVSDGCIGRHGNFKTVTVAGVRRDGQIMPLDGNPGATAAFGQLVAEGHTAVTQEFPVVGVNPEGAVLGADVLDLDHLAQRLAWFDLHLKAGR
jgi:hypothetical protein